MREIVIPVAGRGLLLSGWQTRGWLLRLSYRRTPESRAAGGRPAAGYFLLRGQERSNQREGRPWFTATFVVSLCCSTSSAPVELAVEFDRTH